MPSARTRTAQPWDYDLYSTKPLLFFTVTWKVVSAPAVVVAMQSNVTAACFTTSTGQVTVA